MKFTFEALDKSGKTVRGELMADSRDVAIEKIRAKGYFPTKLAEQPEPKDDPSFKIFPT